MIDEEVGEDAGSNKERLRRVEEPCKRFGCGHRYGNHDEGWDASGCIHSDCSCRKFLDDPAQEQAEAEDEADVEMEDEVPEKIERERYTSSPSPIYRYIGGTAGSGKTFKMREEADLRTMLTSTTGIAAINLGGTTINAALGYFDYGSLAESYSNGWIQSRLRKYRDSGITRWVIDESSMMDGRQLVVLVKAIDEVNEEVLRRWDGDAEDDPRIHLTLVGDFAQLPPVDAPFAFEVPAWEAFEPHQEILTTIYRQEDADFIQALRAARQGHGEKAVEFFRHCMIPRRDFEFAGPTIVATNAEVDRFNSLRYAALEGEEFTFTSEREGKQRGEWKNIPEELRLKPGALVMVLANHRNPRTREYLYVNGDLGTVEGVESEVARVKLHRTGAIVPVVKVRREFLSPTGALGVKKERFRVDGWVEYSPLRLAWAATCHKAQGLSLDAVQVVIYDRFFANPGSVYVALSRARTAEGLKLVGTPDVFIDRCKSDPRVEKWL